ncbi:hypothetical protein SABELLA_28 [Mycobacterium phage Sabella]|uniref:Tail assembly chaperone n=1 Tax=Mycobacterium phage Sabella TaxID=2283293 RepID=A0A345MEQ7_9CAUD|nr:hypothetical protein SABELLA_28 [Mycobacterium phage Sabella]
MTTFAPDGSVLDDDGEDTPTTDEVFNAPVKHEDKAPAIDTTTELAVVEEVKDVAEVDHRWMHDYLEFEGDRLEVRLPTEQALSAFSISVSKYMPAEVQNDMVGLFIAKHMSPESYTHVMARMMDPDDPTYTSKTVGELMGAISRASMAARKAAQETGEEPK